MDVFGAGRWRSVHQWIESGLANRSIAVTRAARKAITVGPKPKEEKPLGASANAIGCCGGDLIGEAAKPQPVRRHRSLTKIMEGLHQAEAGEFATAKEVDAAFARWK